MINAPDDGPKQRREDGRFSRNIARLYPYGILLALLLAVAVFFSFPNAEKMSQQRESPPMHHVHTDGGPSFEVYLPPKLDRTRKHPWVIAFSPGGNGQEMLPCWQDACDRYQWILVGSNDCSNSIAMEDTLKMVEKTVELVEQSYPVDPQKLYAAGLSGGGMMSHYLSHMRGDLVRGIVVNTCMSHVNLQNDTRDLYRASYPEGKCIVFIASPTDFRYDAMKEDRKFLEGLGWKSHWIEFEGGHRYAPSRCYLEAARWLRENAE